ncbi:MAG: DUF5715 family protein [Alloprevotella sp.]
MTIPTPPAPSRHPHRGLFLFAFVLTVATLAVLRIVFPSLTTYMFPWQQTKPVVEALPTDSVRLHALYVDSILLRPRPKLQLVDAKGARVRHKILSVRSYEQEFTDMQDVQIATAQVLGIPHIEDRAEADRRKKDLVCIAANPYYDIKPLGYSIPYLVPRAATCLEEIARAFLDSCAVKGLPLHKLLVTSILRTRHDVGRLRRVNGNASEQSCHQFGTTFDISYNHFVRVCDPDGEEQPPSWGVHLKQILAEVLRDQRNLGTCYVKYERRQSCFHITAR